MINGKNYWKIERRDNYGWIKDENIIFEGEYWDAVKKYNPDNMPEVIIKPTVLTCDEKQTTQIITDKSPNKLNYSEILEIQPKSNHNQSCEKNNQSIVKLIDKNNAINETLLSIYDLFYKCINEIDRKILGVTNLGENCLNIFNFKYINDSSDYKKLKYFYSNLGFNFLYDDKERILQISW